MDEETRSILDVALARGSAKLDTQRIIFHIWLIGLAVCLFIYLCLDQVVVSVPCGAGV